MIAPFCPAGRGDYVSLGGAAKISAVIQGMRENNVDVLLINSGHQLEKNRWTVVGRTKHGGHNCIEIEPPTITKRNIGKLLQCFIAPLMTARLIYRRKPKYLWIYNPYLFEVICLCTAKLINSKLVTVLELEDLPQSRRREGTGMIKNLFDRLALEMALRIVDGVTVVQKEMCRSARNHQLRWYMPVLIGHAEADNAKKIRHPITIGYFGGLMAEKGIDMLIAIIRQFDGNCRWIVCGSGLLENELEMMSLEFPHRLRFLGCLEDQRFRVVYGEVDVIINLHRPIESFAGGVFPYKLLEAVAHGKIVISTPMLGCPDEVMDAIHWLDGDPVEAGLSAVAMIEEIEIKTRAARRQAQKWVIANYSSKSAIGRIFGELQSIS
jgi:glycosyltransferase involved in cell wall biosynthesis